jgi:cell shape-determining protein MreC
MAVVFTLVIGLGVLLPTIFQTASNILLAPVVGFNQWLENSETVLPSLLRDRDRLSERIQTLENQLIVSQVSPLTFSRLQDENQRLRALLHAEGEERIAAAVIARPNDLPYDLLLIDQGSARGVQELAPVYVGTDQVIGVVTNVSTDHSFVRLFTAPDMQLTGFIAGPDVVATLEGVGGGVARMRVPQGIPLTVGDLVYVPGIQPGLFGAIDYIENRPTQPEQFAYVALSIPLNSLHFVAVGSTPIDTATPGVLDDQIAHIVSERLLVEEAHTISFEELLATTTPTSTVESDQ